MLLYYTLVKSSLFHML